jgi:hypothetical protein
MNTRKMVNVAACATWLLPLAAWGASAADLDKTIATVRLLTEKYEQQQRTIQRLETRITKLETEIAQHTADASLAHVRGRGVPSENPTLAKAIAQVNGGAAPNPAGFATVAQASPAQAATPGADSSSGPASPTATDQPTQPSAAGNSAGTSTVQAQAITSTQGIPLFENKFSFEQGLTYTHYDKRNLIVSGFLALDAIVLGKINLQQTKTDQLQYDLTGRWSVTDRISLDLNVPLAYRSSNYISPGAGGAGDAFSDARNSTTALGDVNAGVYYQFKKAAPNDLDWIASVRLRAPTGVSPFGIKYLQNTDPNNNSLVVPTKQPTGNGVFSTSVGLSVLKTYDPIVLFSNIGYTYNLQRSVSDLSPTVGTTVAGDVRLGNAWTFGTGFALALNEKSSMSFAYSQLIQRNSSLRAQGGQWIRQVGSDQNAASFNVGLTNQLSKNLTMVGTLSVGLTPDAPNFSVGVKFPYSF